MPEARTRTRQMGEQPAGTVVSGSGPNAITGQGTRTTPLFKQTTQDIVGSPTTDNVFLSQTTDLSCTPLSGYITNPNGSRRTYSSVGPSICRSYAPLPTDQSLNAKTITARNRSNPSRPVADLGVFAGEVRELPSLLRGAGGAMIRYGAGGLLAYQFGWKPFLNDIKGMMAVQVQMTRRFNELKRLHSKGGLRRRVQISSVSEKRPINKWAACSATGHVVYTNGYAVSTRRSWATCRYEPSDPDGLPPSNEEMLKQALRAVYGLTFDGATAWNLIPWSWLIDWWSNTGDWLETSRNIVGARLVSCCVMTNTRQVVSMSDVASPPTLKGGGSIAVLETKQRQIAPAYVLPELNLGGGMSLRQASILGSLAVLRVPKNRLLAGSAPLPLLKSKLPKSILDWI